MKKFLILMLGLLLGITLALSCVGFLTGDFLYRELKQPHLYQNLFSLVDNSHKLDKIKKAEAANGWQTVSIPSPYGYTLCGTFIPAKENIGTVIITHGLFQNRSTGLDYYDIYQSIGYNVLLVDSRAHGESGGSSVSWGYYEQHDLNAWVKWLQTRQSDAPIGIHGISMGASTAVLHSALNEAAPAVTFYVIDSAYDDFGQLMKYQFSLLNRTSSDALLQTPPAVSLSDLLLFFVQTAAYYEDRINFSDLSPLNAVHTVTTPMLFLHGGADTLIPKEMSENLANALPADKKLHIFPHAPHASSIYKDRRSYHQIVQTFVGSLTKKQ